MATDVYYEPDPDGIAEILRSQAMREVVWAGAQAGAEFARDVAPVQTGEYRAGIRVEDGGFGGPRHDRVAARIVAEAPHSAAVEFGNVNQAAHHVLARTIDSIEAL